MEKAICFFIFMTVSFTIYAKKNNCIFGNEAQKHINKGSKLYKSAKSEEKLFEAATEFELALKYNPQCENIYLTLVDIYIETGKDRSKNILKSKTYSESNEIELHAIQYFEMAKSRLNNLIEIYDDPNFIQEANELFNEIASEEKELVENKTLMVNKFSLEYSKKIEKERSNQIKKKEKEEKEKLKDFSSFLSLGIGYGQSYGQMGLKASIFTAPMGIFLTGGVGYSSDYYFNDAHSPLLWVVGGGYSFGKYKYNTQLQIQYGKIQTKSDKFENTGGLSIAMNFKLFSNFAINADIGYWLSDTSDIAAVFGFSAGLCYRFSFY